MMSDRLRALPERNIFSVFFTAGFPRLKDTRFVLSKLESEGVHMVEIGFPFSDPVADGPTIQDSSVRAIDNGMTVPELFEQLSDVREETKLPILLMGYINPAEQFGFERFLAESARCGVDALIIPDLPFEEYQSRYKSLYAQYGIAPVFLVTRRTPESRVRMFDAEGPAFLYVVSSEATTGGKAQVTSEQQSFFEQLAGLGLRSPLIVGFGVADKSGFEAVSRRTNGAIVGSAFIRAVKDAAAGESADTSDRADLGRRISQFLANFR
jgi:tryptophan synthase alpha chain